MFCNECGKSISEGSKFCLHCGSSLPVTTEQTAQAAAPNSPQPAQAVQQSPPDDEEKTKKGGGFLGSGAGIALVVILGLMLVTGVTFGIIFLVKGSGDSGEVDAATMEVWDEYEKILADDSEKLAQVNMDPTALTKAREDLEKTQNRVAALEKVLQETGGTEARRNPSGTKAGSNKPIDEDIRSDSEEDFFPDDSSGTTTAANTRDQKADEMAAALKSYEKYIEKMNELYGVLVEGNLQDAATINLINSKLKELEALADDVKTTAGDFLKNNAKVVSKTFNPQVLTAPKTIATNVERTVKGQSTATTITPPTDTSPTATEEKMTDTVATDIVGTYVGGGVTMTFNSDGTVTASRPELSISGTYTVSGNTVTCTSTDGVTDSGTIQEDGSIIYSGVRLTKQ